jgi:hypothetical protein
VRLNATIKAGIELGGCGKIESVRFLLVWALINLLVAPIVSGADPESISVRGRLRQEQGKPPVLETSDHKRVSLSGDEPTMKVLRDSRLKDADVEMAGHYAGDGHFEINKIHLPSLFVYRGGKRLQVSYWCDVCYIRTSSPGKCWCCQKETDLDPVEPEH